MSELKPTVGRIVYFIADDGKTCAAIVTGIVTDTTINLAVFHEGMTEYRKDVQQGDLPGTWDWMPYQKQTNAINSQSAEPRPEAAEESAPNEEEIDIPLPESPIEEDGELIYPTQTE